MTTLLLSSGPGYESYLVQELRQSALSGQAGGSGWVLSDHTGSLRTALRRRELCFCRRFLDQSMVRDVDRPAFFAQALCDYFCRAIRNEKIDQSWFFSVQSQETQAVSAAGLHLMEKLFLEKLKKAVARVARLAVVQADLPPGFHRGLFVNIVDAEKAFVSRECWSGGQRRMQFKKDAPSRSFLKVEEAYTVMGIAPQGGETVVDLGAAPGGWSFSAAERGARVTAVDNGPLKAGALDHPAIEHLRKDAFNYQPSAASKADWLFCDLVEEPHHVLQLVRRWLAAAACRRFIVNLKFGRSDPIELLARIYDRKTGLVPYCESLRVRHLYHDREEITLMGVTRPIQSSTVHGSSVDNLKHKKGASHEI